MKKGLKSRFTLFPKLNHSVKVNNRRVVLNHMNDFFAWDFRAHNWLNDYYQMCKVEEGLLWKKKFKVSHLLGKPVEAQFNYVLYSKMPNDTKNNRI